MHEHDDADSLLNMLAYRNLKRGLQFELPSGTDVANALGVDPVALNDGEPDSLWYAILKEAELQHAGQRLGTMGSILVGATFSGLLLGDPRSSVNQHPGWTPDGDVLLRPEDNRDASVDEGRPDWTLAAIIRLAGVPVDAEVFATL